MRRTVWIGYDPREQDAFTVARNSLLAQSDDRVEVYPVSLELLMRDGAYQRPTEVVDGRLYDVISQAPMSTEFAISRFLVPYLCRQFGQHDGLALFCDCDVLFRDSVESLFELADPRFAVQVVKHDYEAVEGLKMDGQVNQPYPRKNWSSVMLFNLEHPALQTLTIAKVNSWAGRALHGFQWLSDQFIGELPACWNHLVGIHDHDPEAKLVHFTLGIPSMAGFENSPFAEEWRAGLAGKFWRRSGIPFGDPACKRPAQLH